MSDNGPTLETAVYSLDEPAPITMTTLRSRSIVLLVGGVDVEYPSVDLHATMSVDQWDRVEGDGAFHVDLQPDELSPDDPDAVVEVVIRLREPFVASLGAIEDLIEPLLGSEVSEFHQTECWMLISAMVQLVDPDAPDSSGAVGFRTPWAGPFR